MQPGDNELIAAVEHMRRGDMESAEAVCRNILKRWPQNVNAMCLLAEIGIRLGVLDGARNLIERCLELAPEFVHARAVYADLLQRSRLFEAALAQLGMLEAARPGNIADQVARANALSQLGRHDAALTVYLDAATRAPDGAGIWMSLGHTYKTLGRQVDAISAYREAARLRPSLGDAYWSLANLKTFRFAEQEIRAMHETLQTPDLALDDVVHFCFALGKALEDDGQFDEAFAAYERGNRARRRTVPWDAEAHHNEMLRLREFFTKLFFADHAGSGSPKRDPIFVVGLPRAGSTLIEQILASHSAVEGTHELPDLLTLARRLSGKREFDDPSAYPEILAISTASDFAAMGEEYIKNTMIYRTGKAFFIDKMPNNFAHIGLIQLILPNAKIIDARRNPLDCCLSCFRQLFARGQNFTYSLREIGLYYADYIELMRHWDEVLPGRVLRVLNEDLIDEPEREIRRILDYCGLEMEPAVLRFHETKRPVRTASSEQVREPLNDRGQGRWRSFDRHLSLLRETLGAAATDYRDPP